MIYNICILDTFGNAHSLRVFGIDKITGTVPEVDLRPIVKHFPNIKIDDVARLSGEDDILIGYDYAGWHPTPEIVSGHLLLLNDI